MKKTLTLIILTLILSAAHSQKVIRLNYLKQDELKQLAGRKLLILSDYESKNNAARLTIELAKAKEKKKADIESALKWHQTRIDLYEKNIEGLVQTFWKHNDLSKLRFVTAAELKEMRKKPEAEQYAVLYYKTFTKDGYSASFTYDGFPTIVLQGAEDFGSGLNLIAFPEMFNDVSQPTIIDLELAVSLFSKYVKDALVSDKRLDVEDWLGLEIAKNCSLIAELPMNALKSDLEVNLSSAEIKASYKGDLNVLSKDKMLEKYVLESDELYSILVPSSIGTMISFLPYSTIIYIRVSIQPSTGKICSSTGILAANLKGEIPYRTKHLEELSECKK